jgi:PPOX class probable F420-dependent enzyme
MTEQRAQRRGRAIAMTREEVDAFLTGERTCRVATVGGDGAPHVAPLWFVWDGERVWLNSLVRSQRWADVARDPRVSLVVDAGVDFAELRGVEVSGAARVVGEVPRQGQPKPALAEVERLFAAKYAPNGEFAVDGRHAWLRIDVEKLVSWDFRKAPAQR